MIRIGLLTSGFLCIVLLLIVLQPTNETDTPRSVAATRDDEIVTRTDTGYEAFESLATNLSRLNQTVAAQDDTSDPAQPGAVAEERAAVEDAPAPAPIPAVADVTPPHADGFEQKIVSALSEALAHDGVASQDHTTSAAAAPALPETLLKADGKVDTAVLLSALQVDRSDAGEDRIHTTQPGDSLKALSYRFYGSTAHVSTILAANSSMLATASDLGAGMQIVIPALR